MDKMIKTCVLGALALFLVPQAKAAGGDWVDEAVKAKLQLQAKIGKQGQLVASDWIKAKRQACPFSVDIAGNKQLVLLTRGGMDGTRDDHAVWAGARLQKADGSYVWLDELDYRMNAKQTVFKNKNVKGSPLSIAKKRYKHGVLNASDGLLVYDLGGKYTRFEAEVGIDNRSVAGSAYFGIMDFDPSSDFSGFKERSGGAYANKVKIGGKAYEANPFGLYNMHGNVCEWTRSNYVAYPYKEKNEEMEAECKVVRGGSFTERPKYSTSYPRKGFLPYHNVSSMLVFVSL